jgi:putative ATPase
VGLRTLLILDEIHHFNRTQQDALLPDVERGLITLIGLTTENPFFYVNAALISRSTVYEFKPPPPLRFGGVGSACAYGSGPGFW